MKIKNIKIAIKSEKELFNEVNAVWEKAEQGEKVKKHEGLYCENLEAMRKILTENRLRILKVIRKEHPSSVYELAKFLKRDVKNTYDDVELLAGLGLIDLKKTKEGRERNTPVVNYEKILLEIQVA
ncbi:MAG: ArsR family transcriptional regulator [Proteobacteria bacterium]|nr:ArsR family transcriptional regulator [Pseudomonadota bacterium]